MNRISFHGAVVPCVFSMSLCIVFSGCLGLGYQVGSKTLFGQDVKTVYVPLFEVEEGRKDIAERLTEAVCKRIEARSPYKVVGRPTADSVLKGTISRDRTLMSLSNNYGDPRQKTGTLSVSVQWLDRRNREIRELETIPWSVGSGNITATDYMVAEYGQSQATLEQTQIDKIADQIVGMMEVPW